MPMDYIIGTKQEGEKDEKIKHSNLIIQKSVQIIALHCMSTTFPNTIFVNSIEEMLVCTQIHALPLHSLNPGYGVVPLAESASP